MSRWVQHHGEKWEVIEDSIFGPIAFCKKCGRMIRVGPPEAPRGILRTS